MHITLKSTRAGGTAQQRTPQKPGRVATAGALCDSASLKRFHRLFLERRHDAAIDGAVTLDDFTRRS